MAGVTRLLLPLLTLAVAACVPQEEIERQLVEQQHARCATAGFQPASESYKLCLLIEAQNQRIEALQRQVLFLQTDIRQLQALRPGFFGFPN